MTTETLPRPKFEVGDEVAVDAGYPGKVTARRWGTFPPFGERGGEQGYIYTVQAPGRPEPQECVPEFDLEAV